MKSFTKITQTAEAYMAANPNLNLYLLIDHAGMPGLYRKLEQSSTNWVSLFDATRESGALSVAPILILLGYQSSLRVNALLLHWISQQAEKSS